MRRRLRILIVDDSADGAERIVGVLRRAGHRPSWRWVDTAGGLAVALSEPDWTWHAITCEAGMPTLHHLSALHISHALAPNTPVIVVADRVGDAQAADLVRQGAYAFLAKDRLEELPDLITRGDATDPVHG